MTEAGFLGCCGSTRFSREMALRAPVSSLDLAVEASRDIWRKKAMQARGGCIHHHPSTGGRPRLGSLDGWISSLQLHDGRRRRKREAMSLNLEFVSGRLFLESGRRRNGVGGRRRGAAMGCSSSLEFPPDALFLGFDSSTQFVFFPLCLLACYFFNIIIFFFLGELKSVVTSNDKRELNYPGSMLCW